MMLEIKIMHGTVWINPYHVSSIENIAVQEGGVMGSFIVMDNGNGWNTPYSSYELAAKIADCKRQFGAAN